MKKNYSSSRGFKAPFPKSATVKRYHSASQNKQENSQRSNYSTYNQNMSNNSNYSNPYIPNQKQAPINSIIDNINDVENLIANENDSIEDLKNKNAKLRKIIIQASGKLNEMSIKLEQRENEYKLEKSQILSELDKISKNYQMYAQSYKDMNQLKKNYDSLLSKYNQNNIVISNYQKNIESLIKNLMQIEESILDFSSDENNFNESFNFLNFLKNRINVNLLKYQKDIDAVSFGEFYKLYSEYIQKAKLENENKKEEEPFVAKKRQVRARKKEYTKYTGINVNNNDRKNLTIDREEYNNPNKKYKFNKNVINIRQRNASFDHYHTNDL